MRLVAGADVAAPQPAVFDTLADVDALVARLRPRRLTLTREPGCDGAAWRAEIAHGGTRRAARLRVVERVPPSRLALAGDGAGLRGRLDLGVQAAGAAASWVEVVVEIAPAGLAGRVLMASLRPMRAHLETRLAERLDTLVRGIETEDRSAAGGAGEAVHSASTRRGSAG